MRTIALEYHDVVRKGEFDSSGFPGVGAASYKLEIEAFEKHLEAIKRTVEVKPIRVFDLLAEVSKQIPFLLTFDDGGSSAYNYIADRLEKLGWVGHFLITANYVGAGSFLSKDQIRALRNRGHIIGTHSCSHPQRMSYCSWEKMIDEWGESVKILSDILGEQIIVASVPGGYYSQKIARAAYVVGIRALFTSEPITKCHYLNGCLVLGRYSIRRWTSSETAAAISSGKVIPRVNQWLFWELLKIAKSFGGKFYLRIRKHFWQERILKSRY